jgi:hypothetical protein
MINLFINCFPGALSSGMTRYLPRAISTFPGGLSE